MRKWGLLCVLLVCTLLGGVPLVYFFQVNMLCERIRYIRMKGGGVAYIHRIGEGEDRSCTAVSEIVIPPHSRRDQIDYSMLRGFPKVRRLVFMDSVMNECDYELISEYLTLKELVVVRSEVGTEQFCYAMHRFSGNSAFLLDVQFDGELKRRFWRAINRITDLQISSSNLSDDDLVGIDSATSLQAISLTGNSLTDSVIQSLDKLNQDVKIDLSDNGLSEDVMLYSSPVFRKAP